MKIHDRGTMKWVSLMLPEHVEMLKTVFVERKEKPLLDEQKMVEIDRILKYAIEHEVAIEITYYDDGEYVTTQGKLEQIDQWRGYIVLKNEHGIQIPLANVIDVETIETEM